MMAPIDLYFAPSPELQAEEGELTSESWEAAR